MGGLCQTLGVPELIGDERFVDAASRLRNKEALWEILEASFAARPAAEWVKLLAAASVPVAPVKNVLEALQDAREADDGSLLTVRRRDLSSRTSRPRSALSTRSTSNRPTRRLSAPTRSRCCTEELGYSEAEVQTLLDDGVLGATRVGAALR